MSFTILMSNIKFYWHFYDVFWFRTTMDSLLTISKIWQKNEWFFDVLLMQLNHTGANSYLNSQIYFHELFSKISVMTWNVLINFFMLFKGCKVFFPVLNKEIVVCERHQNKKVNKHFNIQHQFQNSTPCPNDMIKA